MNRFDTVFIITYGRSGSTLLQGVLNSIDGYLVRGENYSTLFEIFRAYNALEYGRYHYGKDRRYTYDPWYGMDRIDPVLFAQKLLTAFREEVIKPEPHHRVVGFKEIRYGSLYIPSDEEYFEYMAFLRRFFPRAAFIFNERDLSATSKDGWWAEDPMAMTHLREALVRMQQTYKLYSDMSYWVVYDEYVKDVRALEGLYHFLDEPFDADRIMRVLEVEHSY